MLLTRNRGLSHGGSLLSMRNWALQVNGATVSPTCVYLPRDINTGTGAWAEHFGGDSLSLVGSGDAPTYNVTSPFPGADVREGLTYVAGKYHQGSSGPQLASKDLILAVATTSTEVASTTAAVATRTSGQGIQLYKASGVIYLYLQGAGGNANASQAVTLNDSDIFVGCVNADENSTSGGYLFKNGTASSGVNFSGVGAVTDEGALNIGDNLAGGYGLASTIYCVAIWEATGIFSAGGAGAAEMQAVADTITYNLARL